MLRHYGVGATSRVFRSVTPVVLPEEAKRRRIEPARKLAEAKGGGERIVEISRAKSAVVQALRHAGVQASTESIRLQREPFEAAGSRVEPFAEGTRFPKERLWHVEIAFSKPVDGLLLLGDGRFLGLGLMAPATDIVPSVHAFAVTDGLVGWPEPLVIARALRRAVMSRVQATLGPREKLPPFFSGHEEDGSPVRRVRSSHLSFAFDPNERRLLIFAPHVVERRSPTLQELDYLRSLDIALVGLYELRAGNAGVFSLSAVAIGERYDPLLDHSFEWETITPYVVTRHLKAASATDAIVSDLRTVCRRLGLPNVRVEPSKVWSEPKIGLMATVRLRFERPVAGPLLLGRTRYFGGGLFRAVIESDGS